MSNIQTLKSLNESNYSSLYLTSMLHHMLCYVLSSCIPQDFFHMDFICLNEVNIGMMFDWSNTVNDIEYFDTIYYFTIMFIGYI